MKRILFEGTALAILLAFGGTFTTESNAGPFGNQGHWVTLGDGSEECLKHWWQNNCKVGDTRPGSGAGIE
ncbi:hypothetical protein SAMN04488104_101735 [Algoriphagus faecimaris]|uniref:Secreted protein n=1 Tax=Algoriphagus faecimaris TaxID=686796 RepID=A0A1G6SKF6_9BACT|nr:hypothetical protein [Algoriphagus faecimaris]SDD16625.1 hypothetical protein SAMN04488104_101735 [Algoriphagus faecimaris]